MVNAQGTRVIGVENVAVCVEYVADTVFDHWVIVHVFVPPVVVFELFTTDDIFIGDVQVKLVVEFENTPTDVSPVHVAVCVTGVPVCADPFHRKGFKIVQAFAFPETPTE